MQSMWLIYTIQSFSMVKWIFVIPDVIINTGESGGSVFQDNPPAPFTKPAEMDSKALAEALLFSEENIVRELATAELRTRDPDKMLSALNFYPSDV